ncbi:hypothetical protein JYG23_03730 [Sedimentibacter sp. zth1]|uniref:YlxM family DNA-binding protein n=1 Tax=Sedimentibacter sp. zth1 TaxID=2816908 RepID=UPI001A92E898|nr:sigma factor-like helix-turn-helix DNA-binding protein [Sedimentibacter sp. zth1]QSX06577.1 hypothetical protein JYG23_03730 [Sedimentibacter sp. zth1]
MLEKNLFFSILFDYYGSLLKKNQAIIIDLYYNQDFSLGEIAEQLNMSRAGIYDTLKRAEKNLTEYEEKLCLHSKITSYYEAAENIIKTLERIDYCKYKEEIDYIKNETDKILNEG